PTEIYAVSLHDALPISVRWRLPLGALGRAADVLLLRGLVLRVLAARAAAVRRTAESWASRPVVVATAVVHNGLLLAQQREFPDEDRKSTRLNSSHVKIS